MHLPDIDLPDVSNIHIGDTSSILPLLIVGLIAFFIFRKVIKALVAVAFIAGLVYLIQS